jgi:hypothetical protein
LCAREWIAAGVFIPHGCIPCLLLYDCSVAVVMPDGWFLGLEEILCETTPEDKQK